MLPPMPDLKPRLEDLLMGAAECEMVGNLATDPARRAEYRQKAEKLHALAERVRSQVVERPRSDGEFLRQQALRCRTLAATLTDDALKVDLLSLATELEQTAHRDGGVC